MAAIRLTRTHRILIGVVVAGAVIIAAIGFAGSYAAVRTLALHKGFGWFANVFPIGVDAGIVVLLALDLLLTWLRIPFPLLRQTAWLLTGATIAFNGAAAWPDPLGVGMHAIIPVLFVVSVEAARHAIGRVADIVADKHMESVRITRWILAPLPTFKLWRRMKLWELRSYEEVIRREQDRLVYRARLRARYGVAWRRRAPIEALMPLRLARYGVPLTETADAGLQAAGIEVATPVRQLESATERQPSAERDAEAAAGAPAAQSASAQQSGPAEQPPAEPVWQGTPHDSPWFAAPAHYYQGVEYDAQGMPFDPQQMYGPEQAYAQQQAAFAQQQAYTQQQAYEQEQFRRLMVPSNPDQMRPLGHGGGLGAGPGGANGMPANGMPGPTIPGPRGERSFEQVDGQAGGPVNRQAGGRAYDRQEAYEEQPAAEPEADGGTPDTETYPVAGMELPDGVPAEEAYFAAYRNYAQQHAELPNARQFARFLPSIFEGTPPEERQLVKAMRELRYRYASEANAESLP